MLRFPGGAVCLGTGLPPEGEERRLMQDENKYIRMNIN